MIYLSASSIKDFISCERKYWYRRFASGERVSSIAADTGTVVHKIIEKYWDNRPKGESALASWDGDFDYVRASQALEIFYRKFAPHLSKEDVIEKNFTVKWARGIKLIGMMDRITPTGVIYDWKTNKSLPRDLSNDPQFILYHYAYEKLYKRPPASVYFASLEYGRLIKFKHNKVLEDILVKEIIPDMLQHIKDDNYNPTGLYRYSTCKNCFFKEHCQESLGLEEKHELDNKKFTFG